MTTRHFQQAQTPPGAQRHRGRELMMGRDIDGADGRVAREQRLQPFDVQPLRIDRGADHAGACGAKRLPGQRIAGIFDGDGVAGVQGGGGQKQGHLAAARDQDVVGADRQAALGRQIAGQRRPQRRRPARVAVSGQRLEFGAGQRSAERSGQLQSRHQARIGRPVGELHRRRRGPGLRQGRGEARSGGASAPVLRTQIGQVAGDEGAARRLGRQPALQHQLLIGGVDGVAMNAQRAGQGAGAGQAVAGLQPPALDVADDRPRQIDEQGPGGVFDQFNDDGAASHDPAYQVSGKRLF